MDKSLNINDTWQFIILIQANIAEFDITEELVDMLQLKNGTTGVGIKKVVLKTPAKNQESKNISAITTDGANQEKMMI